MLIILYRDIFSNISEGTAFILQGVTEILCNTLKKEGRAFQNIEKYIPILSRVLEVERGTFTPLVFTTTRGMSNECQRYHSRLAELLVVKKQESYASTIA